MVSTAVWRYLRSEVRRLKTTIQGLEQEIAGLRRERAARPSPRVSFEFSTITREALLHVTNDGGDAEIRAPMSIEGALANRPQGEVAAAWADQRDAVAVISRGATRTLRLAKLDLSVFPYAQWEIYVVGPPGSGPPEGGHYAVRAVHTSMIGGDPETHAAPLFLEIAIVSSPETTGPPVHCTVALQPFDAVRLRAV